MAASKFQPMEGRCSVKFSLCRAADSSATDHASRSNEFTRILLATRVTSKDPERPSRSVIMLNQETQPVRLIYFLQLTHEHGHNERKSK